MKKVKIMLTAITVFAVIGGALAFKAKTLHPQISLYTVKVGTTCTGEPQLVTTTDSNFPGTNISASTVQGGTCEIFRTTTAE